MTYGERVYPLFLVSFVVLAGVAESAAIPDPVTCNGTDGQLRKLGETYSFGCIRCTCTSAGDVCVAPKCAAPLCDKYVYQGPGCCPSCAATAESLACRGQDGQLHKLGESYLFGCSSCQCTDSGEICASPMCEPIFCDDYIFGGPGCCPTCADGSINCQGQDGKLHKVGETYPYGCMNCECTEQGERCASPACSPVTCDDYVPVGPGCCPVCQ